MIERESEMSLIMIDIDNFKKINDTHGHNVGDSVIVQISQTLIKNLRNIDIVCRWGGEEFVILLPTADIDNAALLAEKLRGHIENLEVESVGSITASFGISRVVEGDDLKTAVHRADEALYIAKQSGRNCVKLQLG
jgi:diguanylate cyclase (GGDEF)-like protein